MKKFAIILVCMLACFLLFAGCTNQKDRSDSDTNSGNAVEFDEADLKIDAEGQSDAENHSDNAALPGGFTYSFGDSENSDGIVVTTKE